MTSQIATILKNILSNIDNNTDSQGQSIAPGLLFVDKIAGLVVVGEKVQPTEIDGAFAVTKFPISLDSNYDDCINTGCYKDLVPNSNQKGVLYFEDFGTSLSTQNRGGYYNYTSKLRIVCWLNNKLIQGENCQSINHLFINQIRSQLEKGPFNSGNFSKIKVTSTRIIENDMRLFSRYTYPSEAVKFLMHPYEAFGIDISVDYSISQNCLPELILNPSIC